MHNHPSNNSSHLSWIRLFTNTFRWKLKGQIAFSYRVNISEREEASRSMERHYTRAYKKRVLVKSLNGDKNTTSQQLVLLKPGLLLEFMKCHQYPFNSQICVHFVSYLGCASAPSNRTSLAQHILMTALKLIRGSIIMAVEIREIIRHQFVS